tara:strand:- start:577 stop:903 length:327 start_codon:yes stop_codon:yes gene_type:complete
MTELIPSNNDDISKESDLYQKPPSIFKMIKNFSRDIVEYIAKGAVNVSTEDYADRLDTCKACPHLKASYMRCGMCGCLVEHKAKWKTTTCPDSPERWAKQDTISNEKK